jgi:hypothetical protein
MIWSSKGVWYALADTELISNPFKKTKAEVSNRLFDTYGTKADSAFPEEQADNEPVSIW